MQFTKKTSTGKLTAIGKYLIKITRTILIKNLPIVVIFPVLVFFVNCI